MTGTLHMPHSLIESIGEHVRTYVSVFFCKFKNVFVYIYCILVLRTFLILTFKIHLITSFDSFFIDLKRNKSPC